MQADGTDHQDSHDTLYVPFVWVPDGAPRPTDWLARHPDAFWVPARLVHNRPIAPDGAGHAGLGHSDQSAGQGDPTGHENRFTSPGPPSPVNPRRRATAYWLTAQGIGREDPVAAYLRINDYLSELGVGQPLRVGNPDAHADVQHDPLDRANPSGQSASPQGRGGFGNQAAQDDAIRPVYPVETLLGIASGGSVARSALGALVRQFMPDSTAQHTYTQTVQNNASSRPYVNSPLTIQEIIASGKAVPDPGGLPGALRFDVPGTMSRPGVAAGDPEAIVHGTYELVIDPKTNTVYHFLFRSGQ